MSVALHLEVLPLGAIGAEVRGIDLAHVTGMEIDAIKNACAGTMCCCSGMSN